MMQPAAMPLLNSFFPRRPSMQHSVPENRAPTAPKFLADDHEAFPMSFTPAASCWRRGSAVTVAEAAERGVSYRI